jgi:hypothetical protein
LGEIALADTLAGLFLNETGEFGLRELPVETAESAFDFPEVAKLLT